VLALTHFDGTSWSAVDLSAFGSPDTARLTRYFPAGPGKLWLAGDSMNTGKFGRLSLDGQFEDFTADIGADGTVQALGSAGEDAAAVVSKGLAYYLYRFVGGHFQQSSEVPMPNETGFVEIVGMSSVDDIWIAGDRTEAVAYHFDGATLVPMTLDPAFDGLMVKFRYHAANDVWAWAKALGDTVVVTHFDGTSWAAPGELDNLVGTLYSAALGPQRLGFFYGTAGSEMRNIWYQAYTGTKLTERTQLQNQPNCWDAACAGYMLTGPLADGTLLFSFKNLEEKPPGSGKFADVSYLLTANASSL
jgi:hypothetical protein